jgi:hypothetical protein
MPHDSLQRNIQHALCSTDTITTQFRKQSHIEVNFAHFYTITTVKYTHKIFPTILQSHTFYAGQYYYINYLRVTSYC